VPLLPAPLCHPSADAGATRALAFPNAAAVVFGETAGAVGPLAARPHDNSGEPFLSDPSLHRNDAAAVVDDHAIGDPHAVAKGGRAGSALADDENAPVAIIHGAGKGRTSDGGASYNQNKGWDASADPLANYAGHLFQLGCHCRTLISLDFVRSANLMEPWAL
jgi:hypothetical protein